MELLRGPPAASPTFIQMPLVLVADEGSGLGHRPALRPLANAFSLVSEVLQGGLAESSSCPFYSPQLPHVANDTSPLTTGQFASVISKSSFLVIPLPQLSSVVNSERQTHFDLG